MDALLEAQDFVEQRRRRERQERSAIYRCGWCKGFVHWENRGGMFRMVHDEQPITEHEVLPYQIGR